MSLVIFIVITKVFFDIAIANFLFVALLTKG